MPLSQSRSFLRTGFREAEHPAGIVFQTHGKKILRSLQDVFCWLPLATLVDEKVLVLHGGVSDRTDLELLAKLDRHKVQLREPVRLSSHLLSGFTVGVGVTVRCVRSQGRGFTAVPRGKRAAIP